LEEQIWDEAKGLCDGMAESRDEKARSYKGLPNNSCSFSVGKIHLAGQKNREDCPRGHYQNRAKPTAIQESADH
jgi:hypothetical protein